MRRFAVRLALALAAVSALAWRPTRCWLVDLLLITADHLEHANAHAEYDDHTHDALREHNRATFADDIASALVRRAQADEQRGANGRRPVI